MKLRSLLDSFRIGNTFLRKKAGAPWASPWAYARDSNTVGAHRHAAASALIYPGFGRAGNRLQTQLVPAFAKGAQQFIYAITIRNFKRTVQSPVVACNVM